MKAQSRHARTFVLAVILLDSAGIGLMMPVMPDLLTELSDLPVSQAAIWGGYLSMLYAAMQFIFGPVIGGLSDRFGRRPVLLISLFALGLDYLVMAFAPTLFILFIGRFLSGIAAATHSTAQAYLADTTEPDKRAAAFGLVGAAFGLGFILGPLVGGLLGEFDSRMPFLAAAALAFINLVFGYFLFPESLSKENRRSFSFLRANPFGAFAYVSKVGGVAWILIAYFLFQIAFYVYPAVWSYFTAERFGWSSAQIGVSLAVVGFGFALVQGGLIRLFLKWFGDKRVVMIAVACEFLGLLAITVSTQSWMIYSFMPLAVLGAMFNPALTGVLSNMLKADQQGELQGVLSSISGVATIISPVLMTQLLANFTGVAPIVYFPGAPFLMAAILVLVATGPLTLGFVGAAKNKA